MRKAGLKSIRRRMRIFARRAATAGGADALVR